MRLPDPCLVVLIGPSGAGKTTWARRWFGADAVVSADALRAVVGTHEHDQRASKDAFEVLELIVSKRLKRGLTTVIDTTGLEAKRRASWLKLAATAGVPCHAVVFHTSERECRARNRERPRPVPTSVLTSQLRAAARVDTELQGEAFAGIHEPGDVALVAPEFYAAPEAARRQREQPVTLEFGLQISSFTWPGAPGETATKLATVARAAEDAGFTSLWVMDHFVQIPIVGREWEDMLESYTTLGYLAASTSTIRLGTLVTGITYRNLAHLGKLIATLDVLSGGRAICGLGAAWFEREHRLYGWEFPPIDTRYALLEDALELLPLLWGAGSPAFAGRTMTVPEAICYPRPLQEKVPILIGGSGEKRTLRLVAQYADACNLFGDAATVRRKVEVLHGHCAAVGRDPVEIRVTQLSTAATDGDNSAGADDQIGRYRELADAGVQEAIVGLRDLDGTRAAIERFAPVIAAFR